MRLNLYPVYDWCGICLMDSDLSGEYPAFTEWLNENDIARYEHYTYLFVTPHTKLKKIDKSAVAFWFMIECRHAPLVMLRWCDYCTVMDIEVSRKRIFDDPTDKHLLKKYLDIHNSVC